MKTRLTSKQVDTILMALPERELAFVGPSTAEALCRDWLDMGDRLAAAERVVEALRAAEWPRVQQMFYCQKCRDCDGVNGHHTTSCPGIAIRDALAAYDDATTGSAE